MLTETTQLIKYILLVGCNLKRNRINNRSKNIITPVNNKPVNEYRNTLQMPPTSAHLDKNKRSNIENGIAIARVPRNK